MSKKDLKIAKENKNDEFYTQYEDIKKEIDLYYEYNNEVFYNKKVFCPCDDVNYSNFAKYFIDNFDKFGLQKLVCTSYIKENSVYNKGKVFILEKDFKSQQKIEHEEYLNGDGDFRSEEIKRIRDEMDIIVTNPPFSLFRDFFNWIMETKKKFLIIGNINCITYKEIFKEIQNNEIWLGTGLGRWISGFIVPKDYELYGTEVKVNENGQKIVATNSCLWLTNLEHGKRHSFIDLLSMKDNLKYNKTLINKLKKTYNCETYPKYDNYDAIEIPFTNAIPKDYKGVMGVPITFLDKYNPEQFEIIKFRKGNDEKDLCINGKSVYFRILIKIKNT